MILALRLVLPYLDCLLVQEIGEVLLVRPRWIADAVLLQQLLHRLSGQICTKRGRFINIRAQLHGHSNH